MDRWGLTPTCSMALKKRQDGIFHAGVMVHGKEFWFDQQVESLDLADLTFATGFEPKHVYDMGVTDLQLGDVEELVYGSMADDYNWDSYNWVSNNCHHFANEVCMRLTGRGVPQWCLDLGELALGNLHDADEKSWRVAHRRVGKIVMIAWGRYSKMRFVEKGDGGDAPQDGGNVVPAADLCPREQNILNEGAERLKMMQTGF